MLERVRRIDTRWIMVGYLTLLLLLSASVFKLWENLVWGIALVLIYAALDLLWTYLREKTLALPLSALVSGLILALISLPAQSPVFPLLPAILAVFSKQLPQTTRKFRVTIGVVLFSAVLLYLLGAFRLPVATSGAAIGALIFAGLFAGIVLSKPRHLMNPAAFAMGVAAVFLPSVSWWGMAWATPLGDAAAKALFFAMTLVGIFILWHIARFRVAISFLIAYAFFLSIVYLRNGFAAADLLRFLTPQIFDSTTIFFATVMLIEPVTSYFERREHQIYFGIITAFAAVFMTYLGVIFHWVNQDPLVYGLLFGNLAAGLLFLPRAAPSRGA